MQRFNAEGQKGNKLDIRKKVPSKSTQKYTVIPVNMCVQSNIFACGAFGPNSGKTIH